MNRRRLSDGLVVTLSALIWEVLRDGNEGPLLRSLPFHRQFKVPISGPHVREKTSGP